MEQGDGARGGWEQGESGREGGNKMRDRGSDVVREGARERGWRKGGRVEGELREGSGRVEGGLREGVEEGTSVEGKERSRDQTMERREKANGGGRERRREGATERGR